MKRFMLDTNSVSHLIKRQPNLVERVVGAPMTALCISAVTEGEMRFGLARRPEAKALHAAVVELLRRLDVSCLGPARQLNAMELSAPNWSAAAGP